MKVLMFRAWEVLDYSATYSKLATEGVGGTETQMLMHAKTLRGLGHDVNVIGATLSDLTEEGVFFQGTRGRGNVLSLLGSTYADTDVAFVNVKDGLDEVRRLLPGACVVEVCQNGPHFENDASIDVYGMVSSAQFAYYNSNHRRYRHKFMLMPSVPQASMMGGSVGDVEARDQVVWVGSYTKQGLRRWGKAMAVVMARHEGLRWVLCSPSYDFAGGDIVPDALKGLGLPFDRMEFKNLPLAELAVEIKRSKMLLASLGGEDGPSSYLNGHALGVPVLCGDDIYGKYLNPEGTGLRCTTVDDCVEAIMFLLENDDARATMGEMGLKWVQDSLDEEAQAKALEQVMSYAGLLRNGVFPRKRSRQSDAKFPLRYWIERAEVKFARRFGR